MEDFGEEVDYGDAQSQQVIMQGEYMRRLFSGMVQGNREIRSKGTASERQRGHPAGFENYPREESGTQGCGGTEQGGSADLALDE